MPPTAPPRCPPGPLLLAAVLLASPVAAQAPDAGLLAADRQAYATWLDSAPASPSAAVAHREVGDGLSLGGADSDIPLEGVEPLRVERQGGVLMLVNAEGRRPLARGRTTQLGRFTLRAGGSAERPVLTVFDASVARTATGWYPPATGVRFVGPLHPPDRASAVPLLTLDGVQVTATEAGTVRVPIGGVEAELTVRRIPNPETGEAELEVYFQDPTNDNGTYPAGRFVTLDPLEDGRYRLDFNRARNPFCAYSTAYPCPVPWSGNRLERPVEAGERYHAPPKD